MSIKSVVNTNISEATDPVGNRGNLPSSVYAFQCGAATQTAGATNADVFTVSNSVLTAGSEIVGAYQGTLAAGPGAAAGQQQFVTLTFANAHGWTANTHYMEVHFVGSDADAGNLEVGHCSGGSFGTANTLEFIRRAPSAITSQNLMACTWSVVIRKRAKAKA